MRRLFLALICCVVLATSVHAAGISQLNSNTEVRSNGSCDVTLTLTLVLEHAVPDLQFPLPANARNITINGANARSTHTGTSRNVNLSGHVAGAGTYSLVLRYNLPDAVTADGDDLTLTLELLSGFIYPVEQLQFSVTLPGDTPERPSFTSTYYQEATETMMSVVVDGAAIRGSFNSRLQDHETLTMTLPVSESLFPQSMAKKWSLDTYDLVMIGLALLAAIYFFVSMRLGRTQKLRRATAPEGLTAGEVGCWLMGQGLDLTLTVLSWAQMGYILIQPDDNGRVLLHKRMDMGNERSEFEVRYFRNLFGRRTTIDATGYHYARLYDKAKRSVPGVRSIYLRSSGNPYVFRAVAAAIGTFGGIALATSFVRDTGWQIFLGIVLGLMATVFSWIIQSSARCLHHRNKTVLWIAIGCAAIWLWLGFLAQDWIVPMFVIPAQFVAGLAAAYGGRRTEMGQQQFAELWGLRQYLKTVPPEELNRICQLNPDYYYTLMPYALALGVDRAFSRQMGSQRLSGCTWLSSGMDGHMNAREWDQLLRDTVSSMDTLHRRLPIDKLLGKG